MLSAAPRYPEVALAVSFSSPSWSPSCQLLLAILEPYLSAASRHPWRPICQLLLSILDPMLSAAGWPPSDIIISGYLLFRLQLSLSFLGWTTIHPLISRIPYCQLFRQKLATFSFDAEPCIPSAIQLPWLLAALSLAPAICYRNETIYWSAPGCQQCFVQSSPLPVGALWLLVSTHTDSCSFKFSSCQQMEKK